MSLDAIAALLGHKTMTMIYARIADKTGAEEYLAVTEKVEALYDQPRQLPGDNEGAEMRKLRGEMHRRMLGNDYCARPVEMDCHFESICESCTCFVTTIESRPTLRKQREDAVAKGQVGPPHFTKPVASVGLPVVIGEDEVLHGPIDALVAVPPSPVINCWTTLMVRPRRRSTRGP